MTSTNIDNSPKYFFMRLLALIALIISVSDFISMLYQSINVLFYPLSGWDYSWSFFARWHISSFIVMLPVYFYALIYLRREGQLYPEVLEQKSRKWFIYLTLFITALIMMCSLGILFYQFLGEALTIRFSLKIIVLFAVMGLIFYYYLRDLKQRWTSLQLTIVLWIVVVISLVVVGYSIYDLEKKHPRPAPIIPIYSQPLPTQPVAIKSVVIKQKIPYCTGRTLPVTSTEDQLIQQAVKDFAEQRRCDPGANCLKKWNEHGITKFSIAWVPSCTTTWSVFQCASNNIETCCWSLDTPFHTVCSPASIKR